MNIGVAYYPEHWPEDRWPGDAHLMKEMGVDVVRIGEFAWSRMEPRRERFEMDWLVRAVAILAEAGLKVIMCTPTAAPPPWLFKRHPNIVPVDSEGKPWFMGSRRHACLNNRAYLKYARRIVTELAKSFADHADVIGWQIDNELGCGGSGRCYCEDCEQAFRQWLKGRYGSIERLNAKWGTVFWSQEPTDWHEIPAPRRTPERPHPSLMFDYKQFISATCRSFVAQQAEIIRQYATHSQLIATNSTGLQLDQIDQFSLGAATDVAAHDNYPVDESNLNRVALDLDLARSVKGSAFWILEQQAGATLLRARRSQPRPGLLRLWAFQAAARGAELVNFFRWRTCPFAQEMHWYGILDVDGTPRRRYEELYRTIAELKEKSPLWEGNLPRAEVGILLDYASHWALDPEYMAAETDYMRHLRGLYAMLREMGVQVDFLPPRRDTGRYRALIVPMPFVCSSQMAKNLEVFVIQGGTVLVTAPAGYRTEANTTLNAPPPGPLTELLGVEVVEHDVLRPGDLNSITFTEGGETFLTAGFCSLLELRGAQPQATYRQQFYADSPAVTVKPNGSGRAYFLGATVERTCHEYLLKKVLAEAGVARAGWSSKTVEVIPLERAQGAGPLTFVLNHSEEPVTLPLPADTECEELLSGTRQREKLILDGYGVALLTV